MVSALEAEIHMKNLHNYHQGMNQLSIRKIAERRGSPVVGVQTPKQDIFDGKTFKATTAILSRNKTALIWLSLKYVVKSILIFPYEDV